MSLKRSHTAAAALGALSAAVLLAASPALAQKSADTIRATSEQPISLVDRIYNPQPATTLMTNAVFDSLVHYDPIGGKFRPMLAESWKRIDPMTVEFKLRQDVKFHDGEKFDADDVVYTVKYLIHPDHNFRFKGSRYGWIKDAEKIDQYTVRIISKGPYAPALGRLQNNLLIYPEHVLREKGQDFGKTPVGTGPYKVVSVDPQDGVVMEKNADYKMAGPGRPAAKIGRVVVKPVADRQTQLARMMVGDQDLMSSVQVDQAEALAQDPRFDLTVLDTISFSYMQFDSADRSGIGVLKDQRVRKALSHAVDREAIKKALLPSSAQNIPLPAGMCHPWVVGCAYTAKVPEYNPTKAKQLLAEAGLADGFDVEITSWGAVKDIAEAVAGQLRKVGVRAKVDHVVYGVYAKKRREGKLQILMSYWDNAGGAPDIDTTMGFFYLPGERDYIQDKYLHGVTGEGRKEFDPEKREAIYRKAFDYVVENNFHMPITPVPAVVVHSAELKLIPGHKSPEGYLYNWMEWK
jgi:peptide/nickel transport system substrate-binding protein